LVFLTHFFWQNRPTDGSKCRIRHTATTHCNDTLQHLTAPPQQLPMSHILVRMLCYWDALLQCVVALCCSCVLVQCCCSDAAVCCCCTSRILSWMLCCCSVPVQCAVAVLLQCAFAVRWCSVLVQCVGAVCCYSVLQ